MGRVDKHERNGDKKPCKCGHPLSFHHNGKDCLVIVDAKRCQYCKCKEFRLESAETQT